MATHYMTTEEAEARSALALVCKACIRVFLYTRELDREVDTVNDRAFVVCPCGAETTLAIGNVTRGSRRDWSKPPSVAYGSPEHVDCGQK